MFEDKHIVLASSSPRRQELLRRAAITFTVKVNPVKEDFPGNIPVTAIPEYLAEKKAMAAAEICEKEDMILAADTLVLLEDTVIGKPGDENQAKEVLQLLSGKMHRVITGVCIWKNKRVCKFSELTNVFFRELTKEQISYYVEKFHPTDKAGAYGIQEWIGLVGIEKIEGDYFNVVGLPVGKVIEEIRIFDKAKSVKLEYV